MVLQCFSLYYLRQLVYFIEIEICYFLVCFLDTIADSHCLVEGIAHLILLFPR